MRSCVGIPPLPKTRDGLGPTRTWPMDPNAKKKLIGAVIAAACAIAVYYGLIGQKQASSIQNQADQTLGTGPAQQQGAPQNPPASQNTTTAAPAPQSTPSTTPAPSQH